MTASGFVTGDAGHGSRGDHHARPARACTPTSTPSSTRGSRTTSTRTIGGMKLKIRFLRVNERHHSVAIANVQRLRIDPIRTKAQHVNIQAATLDDMLAAYQRVARARLHDGLVGGPAHQRQGAVLLLRDPVRLRAGDRLEPGHGRPGAGGHLGARDLPGHQHLGPHPGRRDRASPSSTSSPTSCATPAMPRCPCPS